MLKIILSGNNRAVAVGLRIATSDTTIKGLVVNDFDRDGINVRDNPAWVNNKIQGNFIGTNAAGTAAVPNGDDGVFLFDGVTGTLIGGPSPADRNVISGNGDNGVRMDGANTRENVVAGNLIGTDATGTQAVPNQQNGIWIKQGSDNTIGSALPGGRNIISGNTQNGILIEGSSAVGNEVFGNYIGTTVTGNALRPNGQNGVALSDARFTLVGGDQQGQGNVISGNGSNGVAIFGENATGTRVEGNKIGLGADGTTNVGNNGNGVSITGGSDRNFIGAVSQHARNVISGNKQSGIRIETDRNEVKNNYIGTNKDGDAPVANEGNGVTIRDGSDNLIGGTGRPLGGEDPGPSAGNVISGNGKEGAVNPGNGVAIIGAAATYNRIWGNFIGTDKDGANPNNNMHNNASGVSSELAGPGNEVGGSTQSEGNTIKNNKRYGIDKEGPNIIESIHNDIGKHPLGGIRINGGTLLAENNTISENGGPASSCSPVRGTPSRRTPSTTTTAWAWTLRAAATTS